jgi:hypothetical protein
MLNVYSEVLTLKPLAARIPLELEEEINEIIEEENLINQQLSEIFSN